MTFEQFIQTWNNKALDVDYFPKEQPWQCVDVAQAYSKEVLNIPYWGAGNAIGRWTTYPKETFDRITKENELPRYGDIIIWGKELGQYGHIAVCIEATTQGFVSFDQNYPLKSKCHKQAHDYTGVLGWLRPKQFNEDTMTEEQKKILALVPEQEKALSALFLRVDALEENLRKRSSKNRVRKVEQKLKKSKKK